MKNILERQEMQTSTNEASSNNLLSWSRADQIAFWIGIVLSVLTVVLAVLTIKLILYAKHLDKVSDKVDVITEAARHYRLDKLAPKGEEDLEYGKKIK